MLFWYALDMPRKTLKGVRAVIGFLVVGFVAILIFVFADNTRFMFAMSADELAKDAAPAMVPAIAKRFSENHELDVAAMRTVLVRAESAVNISTTRAQRVSFWSLAAGWLAFACSALVTILAAYFGVTDHPEPETASSKSEAGTALPIGGGARLRGKRNQKFAQLAVLGALASVAGGLGSRLSQRGVELRRSADQLAAAYDDTENRLLELDPAKTSEINKALARLQRAVSDANY